MANIKVFKLNIFCEVKDLLLHKCLNDIGEIWTKNFTKKNKD